MNFANTNNIDTNTLVKKQKYIDGTWYIKLALAQDDPDVHGHTLHSTNVFCVVGIGLLAEKTEKHVSNIYWFSTLTVGET